MPFMVFEPGVDSSTPHLDTSEVVELMERHLTCYNERSRKCTSLEV